MKQQIKLSIPHLAGNENKYAQDAIESTWITPLGPYVTRFEGMLSEYLGKGDVVALSAGTAAIHVALTLLGVGKGDEMVCQSMTFAASANPIVYLGATPVFVDSEATTCNMNPALLRQAIDDRIKVTSRRPKAIVVVHLYGMPARMDEIMAIACEYEIPVVEDAAEAIGSEYAGRKCGTIGDFGILSFNGNKMITTSGGGALICPDNESAKRALFLATQARENRPYYYHETIGYNYRLSNVSAAIGCAQMEVLGERGYMIFMPKRSVAIRTSWCIATPRKFIRQISGCRRFCSMSHRPSAPMSFANALPLMGLKRDCCGARCICSRYIKMRRRM